MMRFLKRNKVFSLLCFITIVSFISGLLFYGNLNIEDKELVFHNIQSILIEKDHLSFILHYFISYSLIWILGISIIGVFFILFLYSYMVFIFSFECISLFSTLGVSSIMIILLYLLPKLILIIFSFLLSYYASIFSFHLFRHLFFHKSYSFPSIMKQYIKIYLISFIGLIFCVILEYMNYHYLFKIFY